MHDGHENRPLSYSEEIDLARDLIERGDRTHALHHCLGALALEPQRPEWQPLLRGLLSKGDLRAMLEADSFYAAKAALAWHLHEQKELGSALDLIGAVAVAVPHLGFQQWFGVWLEEAAAAKLAIDAGTVLRVLLLGTSFGIGRIRMLPTEQAAARELAPIARFAAETLQDPQVFLLASAVLRRAGDNSDAILMAQRARDAGGEVAQVATIVGLALRAAGEPADAIEVFEGAFEQTRDVIYLQEMFRALVDAGRWTEANELAQTISRSKPPDSESALEYGFVTHALKANLPVPTSPPLDDIRRRSLGHGAILEMGDATANVLRQIASAPDATGESIRAGSVECAVAGHEGPSNRLCMALMFTGSTDMRRASYTNPTPLTFVREGTDTYTLWKLDGDVTVQALAAPPAAVLDWIEQLAQSDADDFLDLWDTARVPPAATARDWVAATIHPRMPLDRVTEGPSWLVRWQICALIGLAHAERGWEGTGRRDALLSLVRGAIDWPMAAAIRVVTEVALREPSAAREVRQTLIDLVQPLKDVPNAALPTALLIALEMLPHVGKDYLETLRDALDARDTDDDEDDRELASDEPEPAADEPPPQPPKRPWWKVWGKN